MKSLRIIKVDCCQGCPFCIDDCSKDYPSYYCKREIKSLDDFLYPKDGTMDTKIDFPEWCPLEVYLER